jgi:hypothetical protein
MRHYVIVSLMLCSAVVSFGRRSSAEETLFRAQDGGAIGCPSEEARILVGPTAIYSGKHNMIENGCLPTTSNVRWASIRTEGALSEMRLVDQANPGAAVYSWFYRSEMVPAAAAPLKDQAPPEQVGDTDPCLGISPDAIVAAFNRHGVRLGGPAGAPLSALNFTQLTEHVVGCGDRCGPCTGYLTVTDPYGQSFTTEEIVARRPGTSDDFSFATVEPLR